MKTHHITAPTILALMMAMLLMAFSACRKSPENIGNNLLDPNSYIGMFKTDTITVTCHSYLEDSIGTKNVTNALLGSMNDPVFGLTNAGFYTQFHISSAGQHYGTNPVLDSLVLQLCISGYYGDTTTWQTAHAYELLDSLSVNESYYNHSVVPTSPVDVANSYQFRPHPKTTHCVVGTDTVQQALIRIPLSAELGNYLINLDSVAYSEPDLFKNYFKGLYVTCEPVSAGGAVTYINLTNNTYSMLQIYYHNDDNPGTSLRYNFYVTTSDTYFNHFDHDYMQGSPEFVQQVMEGDTTLGQEKLYLQTMGGVRSKLRFPFVDHWTDTLERGYIVINEAKLVVPASPADADSNYFTAPSSLILVGFNEDGTTYLLPDYYEGTSYFGGSYDASSRSVSFRISEYIQNLVLKKNSNCGLSMGINGASYTASRWVINGPEAENGTPLKLVVTYSVVTE